MRAKVRIAALAALTSLSVASAGITTSANASTGWIQLRNVHYDKCLYFHTGHGSDIGIYPCRDYDDQRFWPSPSTLAGATQFENKAYGGCLGLWPHADSKPEAWNCGYWPTGLFPSKSITPGNVVTLVTRYDGKNWCLDSTSSKVYAWQCNGAASENWEILDASY